MLQDVAGPVDVPAVLQVEQALDEQERQFEGHAVDAVDVPQQVVVLPDGVVEGHDGDVALDRLVHAHAVAVERERPGQQEEGRGREQPAVEAREPRERCPGDAPAGARGGRVRLHAGRRISSARG